jgi:hypothetical protein
MEAKKGMMEIPSSTLFLHEYNLLLRTYVLNSSALYNIYEPKAFSKKA